MTAEDLNLLNKYVDNNRRTERILAIGVGGGGGNAVNHMYRQGIEKVAFYVANTDRQALENSPVPNKLLLGPTVTKGLGAGNVPDVARQAAEESVEEISNIFDSDTDMVFITAGMGGGTGTGAAPVVARVAREKGILTIGIVTVPFLFEGMKKIRKAMEGAEELRKYTDALLLINNDRLSEIYPDYSFENAFEKSDDILTTAASSISEIITKNGKINLDFRDVDTTLRDGGTAIISSGYGEGENRVTKAIQDALNSPLLKHTDVYSSKRLLFNLFYSPTSQQKFKTSESEEFTSFVTKMVADVDVIWGLTHDESLGDKVKVTILASGFDITIDNDDKVRVEGGGKVENDTPSDAAMDQKLKEIYGHDKIEEKIREKETQRYIILTPEQMDDDNAMEQIEKSPAYNRSPRVINEIRYSGQTAAYKPQADDAKPDTSGHTINFNENDF